MVGQLYKPNDSRADAGFSLFYAGINLGALLEDIYVLPLEKENFFSIIPEELRWHLAFGFAAIVMVISLINFVLLKEA
jgi:POT family proton-dependent oligopeptide transporter